MKPLRNFLDKIHPLFVNGGKFEKLYPLYEALDTFLYTPPDVTPSATHVRDGIDLKRTMFTVVAALGPCILMAMYNTGLQSNTAIANMGIDPTGWRADVMRMAGLGFDQADILSCFVHGALYFIPVFLVCNIVGGLCEATFSIIRKHEINEGFLVTGMLFPLTLAPTIPLWQVAIGIAFGVVFGKEVFGGTGKNFMNPALTARAFLFFAYPANLSGDAVWTAADGFSGATPLGLAAAGGLSAVEGAVSWASAFLGTIQGSMGETSTLACLFGAAVLIGSGIGSWRTMAGMLAGGVVLSTFLNIIGSSTNPMFELSFMWHFVIGSFAFGMVFMATDPVSSAQTDIGRFVYGFLVGVLAIVIRSLNPAYPEGVMLAILFGNVFAPLIDYYVVKANMNRRIKRAEVAL